MSEQTLRDAQNLSKHYGSVEARRVVLGSRRRGDRVDRRQRDCGQVPVRSGAATSGPSCWTAPRPTWTDRTTARHLGIEIVYQDLVVAPELDPAANLFLGREPHRTGTLGQARHAGQGRNAPPRGGGVSAFST